MGKHLTVSRGKKGVHLAGVITLKGDELVWIQDAQPPGRDISKRGQYVLGHRCLENPSSVVPVLGRAGIEGLILESARTEGPTDLHTLLDQITSKAGFMSELIAICAKRWLAEGREYNREAFLESTVEYAKLITLEEDANAVAAQGSCHVEVRLACVDHVTDLQVLQLLLQATHSREWDAWSEEPSTAPWDVLDRTWKVIDRAIAIGQTQLIDDIDALREIVGRLEGPGKRDPSPYKARLAELEAAQKTQAQ